MSTARAVIQSAVCYYWEKGWAYFKTATAFCRRIPGNRCCTSQVRIQRSFLLAKGNLEGFMLLKWRVKIEKTVKNLLSVQNNWISQALICLKFVLKLFDLPRLSSGLVKLQRFLDIHSVLSTVHLIYLIPQAHYTVYCLLQEHSWGSAYDCI